MTWAKYGTEFGDEAVNAGLSDAAYRAHSEAILWIYRMEATETRITMRFPKRLLPRVTGTPDRDIAAKELCDLGWWRERGEEWEVVHHAAVVRESIQAQRRARLRNRESQRRFRQKGGAQTGPEEGPDVSAYVTADLTADPVQTRTENHRGANGEVETPGRAGRKPGHAA
jgi:hypothetical protein